MQGPFERQYLIKELCPGHLHKLSPILLKLTAQLSNSLKIRRITMSSNNSCSSDVPPFHGYVETTVHALRLIHAARQGIIPRITRRLNDTERRSMVKSGAVFIFSVEESGIKRWTGTANLIVGILQSSQIVQQMDYCGRHRALSATFWYDVHVAWKQIHSSDYDSS